MSAGKLPEMKRNLQQNVVQIVCGREMSRLYQSNTDSSLILSSTVLE